MKSAPKLSQLEELQAAIRLAASEAEPPVRAAQIAREFYDSYPELIQPVVEDWVLEKLTSLIGKHRAKLRRDANQQLVFEERLGFKRLPSRIVVSGRRIPRAEATVGDFYRLIQELRKQKNPALEEAIAAHALMKSHSHVGGKPITWAEVVELEAKKAAKKSSK